MTAGGGPGSGSKSKKSAAAARLEAAAAAASANLNQAQQQQPLHQIHNPQQILYNQSSSLSGMLSCSNDVMIVGEPSLMGGDFGEEDERLITRLENNQFDLQTTAN